MKNQYFGDVGDFGKYGLLSMILETDLKLGINWYLTEDDTSSNDGKYIEYLHNSDFINCDKDLLEFLGDCLSSNQRYVRKLKEFNRFNEVASFDDILKVHHVNALSEIGRKKREQIRKDWFNKSIVALSQCDVIFCDPDNGIETKSLSKKSKDSVKYTYIDEIGNMISKGHSLVVYNHRDRSKETDYKARLNEVFQNIGHATTLRIVRFNRYSVRDYLFFIQKDHTTLLEDAIEKLIHNQTWNKLFSVYSI